MDWTPFYEVICEDVLKQKARIGGNWAIAVGATTKAYRDMCRKMIGDELIFVSIKMADSGEIEKRLKER